MSLLNSFTRVTPERPRLRTNGRSGWRIVETFRAGSSRRVRAGALYPDLAARRRFRPVRSAAGFLDHYELGNSSLGFRAMKRSE